MNWRWTVPVLVALAVFDALLGVAVYGSRTWNLDHTEVLEGWAAVRETCLVFFPLLAIPIVLGVIAIIAALKWASRGRR